ncbi:MAG: acyl phosphate:glycerol-3-phosphate acyltransferase [Gaiellaceae bacterium]|nr:acyl phosphate:glycerol-3-phosphate acyltransferase [Gaiellaceae bacterium]
MTAGQVILVVAAYLGGSLPFGYWAGRLRGIDIREAGSGNTGATNVWRVLGKRAGIPVLLLDMAKGFVPALVGMQLYGAGTAIVAGAAAVAGHTFPVLLGFGGGKGVATSAGVVLAVTPLHGIALVIVFAVVLWLFRYVSLASMVAACLYPLTCLLTGEPWPVIVFGAIAALGIVARHRANIGRLRAGTESQTGSFGRGAPGRGAT